MMSGRKSLVSSVADCGAYAKGCHAIVNLSMTDIRGQESQTMDLVHK